MYQGQFLSHFFGHELVKRILTACVVISFVAPSIFSSFAPKKADAYWLVEDPLHIVETVYNGVLLALKYAESIRANFKEYVLDPAAYFLAHALLQQVTLSVVDWINSDFEGWPRFVDDPAVFFTNVADQAAGGFILEKSGDDPLLKKSLDFLCNPRLLRFALANNYVRGFSDRYACTLSTISANWENFTTNIENGGWAMWFQMSQRGQNPYDEYVVSAEELSRRILGAQKTIENQANQGSGFLPQWMKDCIYADPESPEALNKEGTLANCPVVGPGHTVSRLLDKALGSSIFDEKNFADEFGESISLIFNALLSKIFEWGIAALGQAGTGSSPTGGSFLDDFRGTVSDSFTEVEDTLEERMRQQRALEVEYRSELGCEPEPPPAGSPSATAESEECQKAANNIRKIDELLDKLASAEASEDQEELIRVTQEVSAEYSELLPDLTNQGNILRENQESSSSGGGTPLNPPPTGTGSSEKPGTPPNPAN